MNNHDKAISESTGANAGVKSSSVNAGSLTESSDKINLVPGDELELLNLKSFANCDSNFEVIRLSGEEAQDYMDSILAEVFGSGSNEDDSSIR